MAISVDNLSLVTVDDPHGNGQPTKEIIHTDPDTGAVVHSGDFVSVHGGPGSRLRIVHGNPGPSDQTVFETGTSYYPPAPISGRTVISELQVPYLLTDDEHRGLSQLAATLQANAANLAIFLARDCQRVEPPPAAPTPKSGEPAPPAQPKES